MCFNDFDSAVVVVEENIPAQTYGHLIYIYVENTPDEHNSYSEAR